jgi:hypothetical protein
MLEHVTDIDLPAHAGPGGFDHAAVHTRLGRLFVAHTANDAIDVVDCVAGRYLGSVPGLKAVAGALICEQSELVMTSNRGEDTIALFSAADPHDPVKVGVGARPNGLPAIPGAGSCWRPTSGIPAGPARSPCR